MHHGILIIPNNATRAALYGLKQVYDDNIQAFHKLRGVEQALIQKVVTSINEKYIISMKNFTTDQFTGNMCQILAYLLSTYGKISPIFLNDFEK